jgi:hypothetical protein
MTHDEARILSGGDPEQPSAELLAHLSTCAECQAYREQMLALNAKLRRALEMDWQKVQRTNPGTPPALPTGTAPEEALTAQPAAAQVAAPSAPGPSSVTVLKRKAPAPVPRQKRPRLFALAASIAAALVGAFTLWLSRPPESLAAEIVTHVEGEPGSWYKTQPVSADRLAAVLRKSGVKLGTGMDPVVYANSCWFRGHFVPHFVVTTKQGPVTVMILLNEKAAAAQQFKEDGYTGLLVPARTGSVAVISRTPMALEQPARDVVRALQSSN